VPVGFALVFHLPPSLLRSRLLDMSAYLRLGGFPGMRRPFSEVAVPGLESLQSPPFSSMHLVPPPESLTPESHRLSTGHFFIGLVRQKEMPRSRAGLVKSSAPFSLIYNAHLPRLRDGATS
jgi:hypothetical protein